MFLWNCGGSDFIDQHYKHIFTDNLKIIRDNKCRKLFTKEPKFQENKTVYFQKAKLNILSGLNEPVEVWYIKHGHYKNLFNEWKSNTF